MPIRIWKKEEEVRRRRNVRNRERNKKNRHTKEERQSSLELELLEVNQERQGGILRVKSVCPEWNGTCCWSRTPLIIFFICSGKNKKESNITSWLPWPHYAHHLDAFFFLGWPVVLGEPHTTTTTNSYKQATTNWIGRNKKQVERERGKKTEILNFLVFWKSRHFCVHKHTHTHSLSPLGSLLVRANRFYIHKYTWQHWELTWRKAQSIFLLNHSLSLVTLFGGGVGKCQFSQEFLLIDDQSVRLLSLSRAAAAAAPLNYLQ